MGYMDVKSENDHSTVPDDKRRSVNTHYALESHSLLDRILVWPITVRAQGELVAARPFLTTPAELVTEILLFGCGDYFEADNPFSDNTELRAQFIERRSTFRRVLVAWGQVVDQTAVFWALHVVAPKQTVVRCWVDRPLFTKITDDLALHRFPWLAQLGLINIEPTWTVDNSVRFQPAPKFPDLNGPRMRHVRLVGFALSLRNNNMFRNIPTLVLGDLDHAAAPSMDGLYGVFLTSESAPKA
ncbi:hypothetical protein B0H14DRAFT_2564365 [Mycena olivaceomarginata]|nr:hypothetical protein B0H14DRAFT_2564365 [Mycena olivaceomarginata]